MDPFLAEIRIFPWVFAPRGWAECSGQLLSISQNTALFSLLGTYYGGDGRSTFALPDLRGRVPLSSGQGPGLSLYSLGENGGSNTVTLLQSELPGHPHTIPAHNIDQASSGVPDPTRFLALATGGKPFATTGTTGPMMPQALPVAGNGQPHNNLMPYLTLRYCIALQGVFPPRS